MTEIEITTTELVIRVMGADRFLALKSELRIGLAHVVSAEADPAPARRVWKGLRLPGTSIPGVLTAGSFLQHGEWTFWDVHNADKAIVIRLQHEHYSALVLEVEDPAGTARLISAAARAGR